MDVKKRELATRLEKLEQEKKARSDKKREMEQSVQSFIKRGRFDEHMKLCIEEMKDVTEKMMVDTVSMFHDLSAENEKELEDLRRENEQLKKEVNDLRSKNAEPAGRLVETPVLKGFMSTITQSTESFMKDLMERQIKIIDDMHSENQKLKREHNKVLETMESYRKYVELKDKALLQKDKDLEGMTCQNGANLLAKEQLEREVKNLKYENERLMQRFRDVCST